MVFSAIFGQGHDRVILFPLALFAGRGLSLSQEYCSSQNTGSDYSGLSNIYQSNGACFQQCVDQWAFGVVQGNTCWCSNYIPANQKPINECQNNCPGFPSDKCGGDGLFGYIALSKSPSGTFGASTATSTSAPASSSQPSSTEPTSQPSSVASSPSSPPPKASTIVQTTTASASPTTVVSYISPSTSSAPPTSQTSSNSPSNSPSSSTLAPTPSTSAATTSDPPTTSSSATLAPSSTWTPTPVTSLEVITESGAIVTQTVTSMPSVPPQSNLQPQREVKGLSTGGIVGVVIGTLAAIALLAALAFCFFFHRRRSNNDIERPSGGRFSPVRKWIPGRQASILSRTGLLSSEPAPVHEKPDLYVNTSQSQMSRRPSVGASAMMGESAPHSASTATVERRNSRLMFVDQRLNPNALMMGDNGSQTSIGTMQDNRDYTRPLGITNPDPPEHAHYGSNNSENGNGYTNAATTSSSNNYGVLDDTSGLRRRSIGQHESNAIGNHGRLTVVEHSRPTPSNHEDFDTRAWNEHLPAQSASSFLSRWSWPTLANPTRFVPRTRSNGLSALNEVTEEQELEDFSLPRNNATIPAGPDKEGGDSRLSRTRAEDGLGR